MYTATLFGTLSTLLRERPWLAKVVADYEYSTRRERDGSISVQ